MHSLTLTANQNQMNCRNSLLFFILLTGCRYLPCGITYDLDNANKNISQETLIGTYFPDQTTINTTPGYENKKSAQLTLNSDHTFNFSGFPKSTFDFEANFRNNHSETSASGTWTLLKKENRMLLQLQYIFEKPMEGYTASYELYEKDGRLVILIGIGDPDECYYSRLIKSN